MLDISSTGKIRNEIYNSKYQKGQHYNFDIGEIMDELRQNTKYDVYPLFEPLEPPAIQWAH